MSSQRLLLPAALLLVACAPAKTPNDQPVAVALDSITVSALQSHLEYLADDALAGREAGTPGYDDAARYVADTLRDLGALPAIDDTWHQDVALRSFRVRDDAATLQLHLPDGDRQLRYRDDFSLRADATREQVSVRAAVVYAGYGVHAPEFDYSDYDGIDVTGKIVALFSGAPSLLPDAQRAWHASSLTKREVALERGAIGFITLRSREQEQRRAWDDVKDRIGKTASMAWIDPAGRASGLLSEFAASASLSPAAAAILFENAALSYDEVLDASAENRVASFDLGIEVSMSVHAEHDTVHSANVVGMIRGSDPALADEYVVYTAHLDHVGVREDSEDDDKIYNGAYDNAMGIALMLETARAMSKSPPRRSALFVAVTAEEKGLLGSDYFVNNPPLPIPSMVANINLDMPLFLYPLADLIAIGSELSSMGDAIQRATAAEGFELADDPLPEENLFARSDQYSFARKGIPAVFLISGFTSSDDTIDGEAAYRDHLRNYYHEPGDDLTRPIDWDSALRFARVNARIGFELGNADARPFWHTDNPVAKKLASFATGNLR